MPHQLSTATFTRVKLLFHPFLSTLLFQHPLVILVQKYDAVIAVERAEVGDPPDSRRN